MLYGIGSTGGLFSLSVSSLLVLSSELPTSASGSLPSGQADVEVKQCKSFCACPVFRLLSAPRRLRNKPSLKLLLRLSWEGSIGLVATIERVLAELNPNQDFSLLSFRVPVLIVGRWWDFP